MDESGAAAAATGAAPLTETTPAREALAAHPGRVPALAWVIAAGFVALELALSGRYGFMQDELYFIEAGRHLAFGYVDQPPLTPLVDRLTDVLGVTPTAVRVVPALAGGAVVVLAARFAALFGAGRLGRVLAALLTACTPGPAQLRPPRQHDAAGPADLDSGRAVRDGGAAARPAALVAGRRCRSGDRA